MERRKTLELDTQWGTKEMVQLEISNYQNNNCMYIGFLSVGDEYPEPYGDITVNLGNKVPDYCGYIDLNNMPEVEKFIVENEIGEFTGLTERSGFCEYPLYLFDPDKLRELAPDGIETYERNIGVGKQLEDKKMTR